MEDIGKTPIFIKILFLRIILNYCIIISVYTNKGYIGLWYVVHNTCL